MNDKEIVDILRSKKDCNLAAIAVTPWHAHGVDSAIMRLRDSGIELRGFIFAIKHPNSDRCINRSNFISPNVNIEVIECDFESKSIITKTIGNLCAWHKLLNVERAENGNLFYIIRPSYPDFNWINIVKQYNSTLNPVFISIDEGTSSYLVSDKSSSWINYIASLDENKQVFIQRINRSILRILAWPRGITRENISRILKDNDLLYVWNLLNKSQGNALVVNTKMAPYYVKTLKLLPLNAVNQIELIPYENAIVVNSSPPENGLIDPNADLNTFMILFQCLRRHNEKVVFKLHPRESSTERYLNLECNISQIPNVSQEAIISKLNMLPKCVIGIDSTTLVTLNSIYNIPTISLAKIFLSLITDQPTIELVNNYINTFSGLIMMPKDAEELEKCLTNVLSKIEEE